MSRLIFFYLPAYGCTIGSGDKQAPVDCGQMQSISGCVDVLPHLVSLTGTQRSDSDLWEKNKTAVPLGCR